MFQAFHRSAEAASRLARILKLAIVRDLSKPQGGRVTAANRSNNGANFSIKLLTADSPELSEEICERYDRPTSATTVLLINGGEEPQIQPLHSLRSRSKRTDAAIPTRTSQED